MSNTVWNVNGKEYNLHLTTANAIQVEKQLGMGMTEAINHIADTTVIVTILWGALQPYNHGMNLPEVCNLYDEYLASGGNVVKIIDIIVELLAQIGFSNRQEENAVEPV